MIQTKTTAKIQPWTISLRNRVGDSVNYNGNTYVNISGRNSEPPNINDWQLVNAPLDIYSIFVFGNPFQLLKHPSNTLKGVLENNDFILNGFRNDNTIWSKAQCLDASNQDVDESWVPIETLEDLTIN